MVGLTQQAWGSVFSDFCVWKWEVQSPHVVAIWMAIINEHESINGVPYFRTNHWQTHLQELILHDSDIHEEVAISTMVLLLFLWKWQLLKQVHQTGPTSHIYLHTSVALWPELIAREWPRLNFGLALLAPHSLLQTYVVCEPQSTYEMRKMQTSTHGKNHLIFIGTTQCLGTETLPLVRSPALLIL